MTRHYVSEDLNHQQYHCENLKLYGSSTILNNTFGTLQDVNMKLLQ